jgi:hydrogenase maturation protein HypF
VQHALAGESALPVLERQLTTLTNAPLTSSMGRLFDAAAALAGVRQIVNYEAQAAIEFEALAVDGESGAYPLDVEIAREEGQGGFEHLLIDPGPLLATMVQDLRSSVPIAVISARFHQGIARMVKQVVSIIAGQTKLKTVALSGGVWQNMVLLRKTIDLLEADGYRVLLHSKTPTNDGGIALGQAVIAGYKLKVEG